jgi:hypothetical protein
MSIAYLNQVVDFKRPKIDDEYLRGFVLDYSVSLTPVNVLDYSFYFANSGLTCIPMFAAPGQFRR